MLIAVCIKQVPVVSALQFDTETKTLKREGVRTEVSPFDVRALLRAVELRNQHGGEVVAVTMGPPQAREALAECLALGADRALHLCDRAFAGADTLATARALAMALRREAFDLILCGRHSVDAETGQVGPEIAELLDLPQATGACSLEIDPGARVARIERETDAGIDAVVVPLPAVVTAAEDLAAERFTTKAERQAAAAKPIEELAASALSDDPALFGAAGSPTWVVGLDSAAVDRRAQIIEAADPDEAVDALVARLLGHGLFGEWKVQTWPAAEAPALASARVGERDVLVVAEVADGVLRPVTLELLGKAAELAPRLGGGVGALAAGAGAERHVQTLAEHGAARVLLAREPLPGGAIEPFAALLAGVLREQRPGLVLLGSTVFGRDVAPRVAARLQIGLTGDCVDLTVDDQGRVLQHKPAFGGTIVALIASRTRPEMATIRPGMLAPGEARPGRRAEVVEVEAPAAPNRVRIESSRRTAEAAAVLDHAEVVIGFGKGIGGAENLPVIEALAGALGGAVCTTRDVTDAGWMAKQYQVGLTGRAIAPKLYVAVALRGAFEHTVGIRRAGLVVAINKSAKAPIFKVCDYGIVGDYAVVVPLLTRRLAEMRGIVSG
jgi:electron transfer flavoprotein alpha subunit